MCFWKTKVRHVLSLIHSDVVCDAFCDRVSCWNGVLNNHIFCKSLWGKVMFGLEKSKLFGKLANFAKKIKRFASVFKFSLNFEHLFGRFFLKLAKVQEKQIFFRWNSCETPFLTNDLRKNASFCKQFAISKISKTYNFGSLLLRNSMWRHWVFSRLFQLHKRIAQITTACCPIFSVTFQKRLQKEKMPSAKKHHKIKTSTFSRDFTYPMKHKITQFFVTC